MVLYSIRLDMGRMKIPLSEGEDVISTNIEYQNVIDMVQSALNSPYVRRMKMLAKSL